MTLYSSHGNVDHYVILYSKTRGPVDVNCIIVGVGDQFVTLHIHLGMGTSI